MSETTEYLNKKREEVLKAIKPIMQAFNITDYDYVITQERHEILEINGQKIGCSCNSIDAVINEIIGYIFVKIYCKQRYIGNFRTQTLNVIKAYWINE